MLSSRPEPVKSGDVRDLIDNSTARISIIDNTVVDPPLFALTLDLGADGNGKQVPLLIKNADQNVTMFDLINMLNKLGFYVDYQEIR